MTLATEHSAEYQPGHRYKPCTEAFCDGIEFSLGRIPKSIAWKGSFDLIKWLNTCVTSLSFKHALISEKGGETFMWLTLHPDATQITPRTMSQLVHTHRIICDHAHNIWGCSKRVSESIEPTKIDLAFDLQGAFIPAEGKSYQKEFK